MKAKRLCGISLLLAVAALPLNQPCAFGCTVCHSKNQKMVKMHKELEYKDCFDCHLNGKRTAEEQKGQMANDQRCTRCHKK